MFVYYGHSALELFTIGRGNHFPVSLYRQSERMNAIVSVSEWIFQHEIFHNGNGLLFFS